MSGNPTGADWLDSGCLVVHANGGAGRFNLEFTANLSFSIHSWLPFLVIARRSAREFFGSNRFIMNVFGADGSWRSGSVESYRMAVRLAKAGKLSIARRRKVLCAEDRGTGRACTPCGGSIGKAFLD